MKGTCSFTMDLGVILSFLLIGSVFYHKFGLYMGFSLKPFMITLAIVFFFCLAQRVKLISKLYLYESLFLVFLLYSTLRGLFSQDLVSFFRLVLGFVIVLSYYWFTSSLTSKLSADKIANILLLSGFFFLLASYLLYFFGSGFVMDRGLRRLSGTVTDPNLFVLFVIPILFVSLHCYIVKRELWMGLLFVVSSFAILLSVSRGGIVAAACGLLFYLFFSSDLVRRTKKRIAITIISSIIVMLLILNFTSVDLVRVVDQRTSDLQTGSGRTRIWSNGLKLLSDFPVLGIGLYNFQSYNIKYFGDNHYMHNTYLEVLVEGGLIGALLFGAFILAFVFRRSSSAYGRLLKIIALTQMAALFFLSGLLNEAVYLSFAVYKGLEHGNSACENITNQ